jgi:hypothetical protein
VLDTKQKPVPAHIYHDAYGRWVFEFKNGMGHKRDYVFKIFRGKNVILDRFKYTECERCIISGNNKDWTTAPVKYIRNWPL